MATLTRTGRILLFDDVPSNSNPTRKHGDWLQNVQGLQVRSPQGPRDVALLAGEQVTLFDGSRSLGADSSTEYALALSVLDPSRYRLSWTGTGSDPVFRTARTVNVATGTLTLALQPNSIVLVTSSLGSVFSAVQVGDDVLIPGVSTGDAALFDPLNEGAWTVLARTGTQLTLARKPGDAATGASETVPIASNSQFLAFSAAGVQVDDVAVLAPAFPAAVQRAYPVLAASSKWIEFSSSVPLAGFTVVPGASALAVYSAAKRYLYLEADQEVAVFLNGNTVPTDIVERLPNGINGWFEKYGTVYSLVVQNRSTAAATVIWMSAE